MGVNNSVIPVNFDISIPRVPAKPFMDYAVVAGDEIYFDFGLKKSIGPLTVIMPLYQGWDDPSMIEDENWLLDRLRFSLSISSFNIRDMF